MEGEAQQKLRSAYEFDEQAEQSERAAKITRGELVGSRKSRTARIEEAKAELLDIRDALAIHKEQAAVLLKSEEQRVRQSVQAAVDAEFKNKIGPALVQLHQSFFTVDRLKAELIGRGFGWYGAPVKVDTEEFFGSTFDRASDFAQLLRKCAQAEYITLPKELA
jgi:hypothetical protein